MSPAAKEPETSEEVSSVVSGDGPTTVTGLVLSGLYAAVGIVSTVMYGTQFYNGIKARMIKNA